MSVLMAFGFLLSGIGILDVVRRSFLRASFGAIIREDDPIAFWSIMTVLAGFGFGAVILAILRFFGTTL